MVSTPTVRRRRVGAELRRIREAAGMTLEDAAKVLECSISKISRMETGHVKARVRDIRELLDAYGLADEQRRNALLNLARNADQQDWWIDFSDVLSSLAQHYLSLESDAAWFCCFQPLVVPGLLQTEDYARAVISAGQIEETPEKVEKRVGIRMARQEILFRPNPVRLWVVLDEAVLRREVGGREVMRGQLKRLADAAVMPNITLQVLPYEVGAHAGIDGPFVLIGFPEREDPDVVFLENMTSSLYLENNEAVYRYKLAFDHIRAEALSPRRSEELIRKLAKEFV
ncbi:XRE family transcriptional regulator [Carbonactinospora thermoautotrophica]|uniref:XRE family transcriptional regulator n=2 Tax=Carbonactinospora thermoautotrophica TaxID=1469144 RepID=A0A132NGL6_9ACTN|nr:helix-turn-helix transcriptional regulator [Carbonactinospora thermoautotrophica]KWX03386.1 XRE family transcriptional regulator [Carbonactinospora thermoautotrophica]KWX09097.1 XRE family transcriptional regulator [Carbonactinospora thermoautotrophica]MCX9190085.1 XRE family transcriptional regulator [Carbonactinospora thermoautotrophica]